MRLACLLLYVAGALPGLAENQKPKVLLDGEDVWLLVMNIPEVIQLEARQGCPQVWISPLGKELMSAQVRNRCPKSGNGMIGNYTVDLRDGRIWFDVDETKVIDSERLQRLRKVLLSRHEPPPAKKRGTDGR